MVRILISACLAGEPVRYNGADKRVEDEILARWRDEGRLVVVCPELAGGLGVPRPPSEIIGEGGGLAVLQGTAQVEDLHGRNVTPALVAGAHEALEMARRNNVGAAVLTDRSPSCGSTTIHDGTFGSGMKPGLMGVAAALLGSHGIAVFNEHSLAAADRFVRDLESK
ncbi:DUF523 domain-containing protein [uncultured Paludibaculum sp.]|uniref:DUF523 domain-containing protein n=1 Tax=uncultured Paludibaculum sp. TaxID=1765020 RepID=UPI002AAB3C8A|nr:DUF523 domain-containing protein [uncultured Paludibaculum sp.]